ncbi:MAG TPA: hypothetical protein VFF81_08115 [Noviherbaspirillum sp.]|nr:hypothetical protein [Noviherbaspirillum sp.]
MNDSKWFYRILSLYRATTTCGKQKPPEARRFPGTFGRSLLKLGKIVGGLDS